MRIPQNLEIVLIWNLRHIFYVKAIISTDLEISIKVKFLIINNNNEYLQKNPCFVFKFQQIRNLSNTFINTNNVYASLIIVNPLRKQIRRTLINAIHTIETTQKPFFLNNHVFWMIIFPIKIAEILIYFRNNSGSDLPFLF